MWGFITIWLLVHVGLGSKSSIALDGFGRCHHIRRLIYTYIHTYNIYNIIHRFVCLNIILCVIYIYIWMNILYIYIYIYVYYTYFIERERGVCVCVCVCAKKKYLSRQSIFNIPRMDHLWRLGAAATPAGAEAKSVVHVRRRTGASSLGAFSWVVSCIRWICVAKKN